MEKKIKYTLQYMTFGCYDDGYQIEHDLTSHLSNTFLNCTTDREALLLSIDTTKPWYAKEYCRHGRKSYPTKIVKEIYEVNEEGWERKTFVEIPIPRCEACICGVTFWPIKGEKACHQMVPV